MEELLSNLEKKLKTLIDDHQRLKTLNHEIMQTQKHTLRDNESLADKQAAAVLQIEGLIARLKAIEEIA